MKFVDDDDDDDDDEMTGLRFCSLIALVLQTFATKSNKQIQYNN